MTTARTPTLFEELGGETGLMAAVDLFYTKVLADPVTRPFFDGLDMAAQTAKQISFMSRAMGGPEEYRGRDLRSAHAPLVARGLGDRHFDAVATHLAETLRELGATEGLVERALAIVAGTRNEVLGR
jgi:hemoglobin